MQFKRQRIRDPLHNLIEFGANEFEHTLWSVIDTPPFQRLRRIKQLGFTDFVFPGATHSRFAHSVGAFHVARRLMRIVEEYLGQERYRESKAHAAIAAALVHDLGHGPFSHAFEEVGKTVKLNLVPKHEFATERIVRDSEVTKALNSLGSGFANDVADIIVAGPSNIYSAVVSSQFDADRLDYMGRDRLMTGTRHAAIDFEWLVANLEVGSVEVGVDEQEAGSIDTFVLGPKAVYAAEAYVLGLFQLYPTVYFHKATRGAERLFVQLLLRLIGLVRDDRYELISLPLHHPLMRFAKAPDELKNILILDDTVIWGALAILEDSKDAVLQDTAKRLRTRDLYKSIDVRQRVEQELNLEADANGSARVTRVCTRIEERLNDWRDADESQSMRVLIDKGERVPYKQFQESKVPLNQIRIRTPSNKLVDLGSRSEVVRAIETFRFNRVYVARGDAESRTLVEDAIAEEIHYAKKSEV